MVYPCQELLQFPYQLSGLVLHVLQPVFRTSLCDLRYFCVSLEVLYNLLTSRGDSDA